MTLRIVMAVNSLIMLPATASIFGSGNPISDMGRVAGWTTFTIEHMVYGLVLGLLVAIAPAASRTGSRSHSAHQ